MEGTSGNNDCLLCGREMRNLVVGNQTEGDMGGSYGGNDCPSCAREIRNFVGYQPEGEMEGSFGNYNFPSDGREIRNFVGNQTEDDMKNAYGCNDSPSDGTEIRNFTGYPTASDIEDFYEGNDDISHGMETINSIITDFADHELNWNRNDNFSNNESPLDGIELLNILTDFPNKRCSNLSDSLKEKPEQFDEEESRCTLVAVGAEGNEYDSGNENSGSVNIQDIPNDPIEFGLLGRNTENDFNDLEDGHILIGDFSNFHQNIPLTPNSSGNDYLPNNPLEEDFSCHDIYPKQHGQAEETSQEQTYQSHVNFGQIVSQVLTRKRSLESTSSGRARSRARKNEFGLPEEQVERILHFSDESTKLACYQIEPFSSLDEEEQTKDLRGVSRVKSSHRMLKNLCKAILLYLNMSTKKGRDFKGLHNTLKNTSAYSIEKDFPTGSSNMKQKMKLFLRERRSDRTIQSFQEIVADRSRATETFQQFSPKFKEWGLAHLSNLPVRSQNFGSILQFDSHLRAIVLQEINSCHILGMSRADICEHFKDLFSFGDVDLALLWGCRCDECKTIFPFIEDFPIDSFFESRIPDRITEALRWKYSKLKAKQLCDILNSCEESREVSQSTQEVLRTLPHFRGWTPSDFSDAFETVHHCTCLTSPRPRRNCRSARSNEEYLEDSQESSEEDTDEEDDESCNVDPAIQEVELLFQALLLPSFLD